MTHAALPFSAAADEPRRLLTGGAVFLFAALSLVVPTGYSLGPLILLLASVTLAVKRPGLRLERADRWLMVALCAYTAVVMVGALWHGQGLSSVDRPLRFWLALPVLFWVMAYPPRLGAVWSGVALGALGAAGFALYQHGQGAFRAYGYMHPIQFGNISLLLGIFCLAGAGWAWQQPRRRLWLGLLGLGAASGILASLLSGSRGGWVGLPLVFWVLYRAYGRGLPLKTRLLALALVLAAGLAAYGLPQTGVKHRVAQAVDDIALYVSGERQDTSVGLRFEMWQGAARLIADKPLMGWGDRGYREGVTDLAKRGAVHPRVADYGHAHNQFLDTLAKQGVPGFVALLALLLVPLRLFGVYLRDDDLTVRALATAGALLCVAHVDYGLTQAGFNHNSGVMVYAFWLVIWWGLLHCYRCRQGAFPAREAGR
ncbi:O-antigen ligase family protein [Halomonas piscis]|uniref:O-antigen ligase family protein n=1 Tax=Halomonas piscis TaxID=3031727 RepID=A0ABY9YZ00_9GAMM|nr:O-antigen ligase family protein [Halomonas piscis]WNK20094.1 O-antigen ligase family protein [Halomonas piscis]